jgi:AcrR family transcriptional regulator
MSPGLQFRSQSVDQRIKDAVIATVAEAGIAGLDVAAICARAGVSRTCFHDRWPDAWSALLDVVDERARLPTIPDAGSLLGDLVAGVQAHFWFCGDRTFTAFIFCVMAEAKCDSRLQKKLGPGFEQRRARNLAMIERAVARGELPPDVDGNAILDASLTMGLAWMGKGVMPPEAEIVCAMQALIAKAKAAVHAPTRSPRSSPKPAAAYRLYLFDGAPAGLGRITEVQTLELASEDLAIDAANARRRGGYAELWKEGHLVRIFDVA